MSKHEMTAKRIDEIENNRAENVTLDEVNGLANALNVHPFTLLWPDDTTDEESLIIDEFFKTLTTEKIKQFAAMTIL